MIDRLSIGELRAKRRLRKPSMAKLMVLLDRDHQ